MSMFPIASATLSSANIDITNIPQTFTHLQIRLVSRDTGNVATTSFSATAYLTVNNDSGANYAVQYLVGDGSSFGSYGGYAPNYTSMTLSNVGGPYSGQTANVFASTIIDILDYTNTSKTKVFKTFTGMDLNGYGKVFLQGSMWNSTAAINRITITNDGGTFAAGSRIDIYGISTANATGA
jgi:hypothetical protein